jgi:TolB-like protein
MDEISGGSAVIATRRLAGPTIVVALLAVSTAVIGWLFWARSSAMNSPIPAVAVLPFRNVSDDPASDYFTDGLTIELIDALTKVEQLKVVSWNSAVRFRGKAGSLPELRDQLHAGSVLDGTVRRYGDRLLVTAQLNDTHGGETIWSGKYERQAKDIFQIQEEIAKSVVYSLKVPLRVDPQRILVPPRTESQEAYNDYLHSRYYRSQFSRDGLFKSNEYAEKAIAEDPKYPTSYGLLANNYALLGYFGVIPLAEAAGKARDLARKAIAIDSSSSEAHSALGAALGLGDWDWKAAQLELDRAMQWSPGSSGAHAFMAIAYLAPMGQFEAAEYEAGRSVELDPLSFLANDTAGYVFLARGKYQESIDRYSAALEIYDGFPETHWNHGVALAAAGRKEEARAEFIRSCEVLGGKSCGPGAAGYAILGEVDKSRALLERGGLKPIEQARAHAVLGDRDPAFDALSKAVDGRDPQVVFIQSDTTFTSLRNDPRYDVLLKRLNLHR